MSLRQPPSRRSLSTRRQPNQTHPEASVADVNLDQEVIVLDNQSDSLVTDPPPYEVFASDGVAETGAFELATDAPDRPISLTLEDLAPLIQESIARWEATGLTEEQSRALLGASYEVVALGDNILGSTEGFVIRIDDNAAGRDWFYDPTPQDDSEFQLVAGSENRYVAIVGSEADGRVDLLTILMHEQGHILGLVHGDGLDGVVDVSERILPEAGQASEADEDSLRWPHFALTTATIAGDTLTIVGDTADDAIILRTMSKAPMEGPSSPIGGWKWREQYLG